MDKATQLLCDLFDGVPGPDDLIGKAGGRIVEAVMNTTGRIDSVDGPITHPRDWLARYNIPITEGGPAEMCNGSAAALFIHPPGDSADGARVTIPIGYDINDPRVAWTVWHEIGHAADYIEVVGGRAGHRRDGCYSTMHHGALRQHQEEIVTWSNNNRPETYDYKRQPNELWAECVACAVMTPGRMPAALLNAIMPDLKARNIPVGPLPLVTGNLTLREIIANLEMTIEKIGGYWLVKKGDMDICREGEVDGIWRELTKLGYIIRDEQPAAPPPPAFIRFDDMSAEIEALGAPLSPSFIDFNEQAAGRLHRLPARSAEAEADLRDHGHVALYRLRNFMSQRQADTVRDCIKNSEEWEFFARKMIELAAIVDAMPTSYETDKGPAGETIAHLHYFAGGQANFYITEKDKGEPSTGVVQHQAFGRADLYGDGGELGYISLPEIFGSGGELDFHWTPKTLDAIEAERRGKEEEMPSIKSFFCALFCQLFGHRWKWRSDYRDHVCVRCHLPQRLMLNDETSAYLRAAMQKQRRCDALSRNQKKPIKPPPL